VSLPRFDRLDRRVVVALIVCADLLVLGLGWLLLVSPQRQQAASTATAVNQTQAEILQAQTDLEAATAPPVALKQPPILTADLYRLAKAMPSDQDMPDLLLELDQVARASGVTVGSIRPGPQTAATGFGIVPISLTFTGDFYSLTDLLFRLRALVSVRHGDLDASGRLFSIAEVDLTPQTGTRLLDASVTVNAYIYGAGQVAVPTTPADTTATDTTSAP